MRANYFTVPREQQRRLQKAVNQKIEDKQYFLTGRILGFACIALNRGFGFGRKRLEKFTLLINELSEQYIDIWDDIGNQILSKELRKLGIKSLADYISGESEKYNEEETQCTPTTTV